MPTEGDTGGTSVVNALDALFEPWNRTDTPGLTVGVARNGQVIYRRGFGMASLEAAVANTPRTRMRIGSTSKHFTCLLALLLAEEGKLDLDAPIRAYIPELSGPGGEPSLRLLMQHRGGSRCYVDMGLTCRGLAAPPIGTALAIQVRQQGRNFAPGEAMIYNNGGYHLASIAIERLGGAPFESQLNERLFAPLGMADTASIPSDYEITPGMASMHLPLRGGGWRRGLFPSEELKGEGAIVSTIDDMLVWMAHLRARDRFGSAATWGELTAPPHYPDGSSGMYALGLMLHTYRGLRTVHHAGAVFGGSAQMLTLPDHGLDIVILANGGPKATPTRLAEQVVDIVLADRVGEVEASLSAADYPGCLGDWWSPETGMVYSLAEQDGALKLGFFGNTFAMTALSRAADGRVIWPASSIGEIGLDLTGAGKAGAITIAFGGRSAIYRKVSPTDADPAAFAAAASGRYFSADADASATIESEDGGLTVRFSDGLGEVRPTLTPMGDTLALTSPPAPLIQHWSALTFDRRGGSMTGFRLNTPRTRNLRFQRA